MEYLIPESSNTKKSKGVQRKHYRSQRSVVNMESFISGKIIHIIFQRKSQDTFAINACLLSFGMSTRCKFSAYSGIVKGVIQLQVRHLVLQLKTQTLGALDLCDWCELIVSLSVEYVLELYRVRMKARVLRERGPLSSR